MLRELLFTMKRASSVPLRRLRRSIIIVFIALCALSAFATASPLQSLPEASLESRSVVRSHLLLARPFTIT